MNMVRSRYLFLALGATVLWNSPAEAANQPASANDLARPNVLFIVSDDLNNSLGCYGNPVVKSPNIDRLAARGMRFDRAYCNYPVCNPSRTSFLSGRRPETTGVLDNATPPRSHLKDAVFLPEFFRQHGYRTIKVGKIFHTGDEFEDPRSWDTDIRETKQAKNPPADQILRRQGPNGIVLRAEDEDTWEGFVARRAVELMQEAAANGNPFFVAAGFRMPHSPYIAPEKYYALYDPEELRPRPGPPDHLAKVPDLALTYRTSVNARFPERAPRRHHRRLLCGHQLHGRAGGRVTRCPPSPGTRRPHDRGLHERPWLSSRRTWWAMAQIESLRGMRPHSTDRCRTRGQARHLAAARRIRGSLSHTGGSLRLAAAGGTRRHEFQTATG